MFRNILDEIIAVKRKEIAEKKIKLSLEKLIKRLKKVGPPRDFKKSVFNRKGVSIIAEIKRFSPSAGALRDSIDPFKLARLYQENGASAISVLLDKRFFGGSLEDLEKVRKATFLPVLAKEFIIDEYQIYEARLKGADAILLIARILDEEKLLHFSKIIQDLNLACIVEIHSPEEVKKLFSLPSSVIIGINNRNLKNFKVDLSTTKLILNLIPPDRMIISESGIKEVQDIKKLRNAGISVFLIGEAILRSEDPAKKLRELCYGKS